MAYRILVSAPVPLVLIGFLNWVGPRGLGYKVLGTGLDNILRPLFQTTMIFAVQEIIFLDKKLGNLSQASHNKTKKYFKAICQRLFEAKITFDFK